MRVIMNSDEDMEILDFSSPVFDIESRAQDTEYSAIQMFATSLGICTYSILASYAEQIDISSDDIGIRLQWSYAEKPFRISHIEMGIDWPQLPHSRLEAAQRAAAMCTLHNTLSHPPEVITRIISPK